MGSKVLGSGVVRFLILDCGLQICCNRPRHHFEKMLQNLLFIDYGDDPTNPKSKIRNHKRPTPGGSSVPPW